MRGDLADVRLAEQVFAPHYAAPLKARAMHAIALFADRNLSERIADLPAGTVFEVLELAGRHAWGLAVRANIVGYVDRTALDKVSDFDS